MIKRWHNDLPIILRCTCQGVLYTLYTLYQQQSMKLSYSYTCKLPHIEMQVALLTYILVDSSHFRIWLPP